MSGIEMVEWWQTRSKVVVSKVRNEMRKEASVRQKKEIQHQVGIISLEL